MPSYASTKLFYRYLKMLLDATDVWSTRLEQSMESSFGEMARRTQDRPIARQIRRRHRQLIVSSIQRKKKL
uniref:Uncharacterized protein n=1 Tax=Caenorhabditis japonica TaxID=281687 RepID=A0A8R1HUP6_CAEJA